MRLGKKLAQCIDCAVSEYAKSTGELLSHAGSHVLELRERLDLARDTARRTRDILENILQKIRKNRLT